MKGATAMKKLVAAAAALATAINAAALSANAMFENIPAGRIWDEEIDMFPMMENGELITDIDGNGQFDLIDCDLFYGYSLSCKTDKDISDNINAFGDYNGDGIADSNDAEHLIRFYIYKNSLKMEDLSAEAYPVMSDSFIDELICQSDYLMASYPMFCEAERSGLISCDVNGDGTYDYTDLDYIWLFGYNEYFFVFNSLPDEEKPLIPDETAKRCEELYDYVTYTLDSSWFYNYVKMYCIEKNGISSEQFSEEYYDSLIEGSGKFSLGKCLKSNCDEWLPQNKYTEYSGTVFNREYTDYWQKLVSGEADLPDTDGDGDINIADIFNVLVYSEDLYAGTDAEASVLPENIRMFFTEDCDINSNGLSGDIHDLKILELAYTFSIQDDEADGLFIDFSESYSAYVEMLADANGISAVKYHPETLNPTCTSDTDVIRSGDANNDGEVDLADSVMIMQTLANPDKYSMSYAGKFNGDVSNTGDGITVEDAQEIQSRLLDIK